MSLNKKKATAEITTALLCRAGTEKLAAANKKVREYRKITAESLKAVRTMGFGDKTALEIMLAEADHNKNTVSVTEGNHVIDIHRADEKEQVSKAGAVTLPKELRAALSIPIGAVVDIDSDGECIMIRKHIPICHFCRGVKDVKNVMGMEICKGCAKKIYIRAGAENDR